MKTPPTEASLSWSEDQGMNTGTVLVWCVFVCVVLYTVLPLTLTGTFTVVGAFGTETFGAAGAGRGAGYACKGQPSFPRGTKTTAARVTAPLP